MSGYRLNTMMSNKPQDIKPDHITVCICTFHRPELLSKALSGITRQITGSAFTFEVVVVDNDYRRSAEEAVRLFQPGNATEIIYDCEPEQNIALARNRAIQNATGNLIAFIDDDEYPVEEWLILLHRTLKQCNADGALGPVVPAYPPEAPQWLKKGNIFNRRRLPTGTRLTTRDTRTGNVLMLRSILPEGSTWFDPSLGRTGGEDVDFFRKQIALGRVFFWCDEAETYETVTPDRWLSSFHLKKNFKIGALNGESLRKSGFSGFFGLLKRLVSLPFWSIVLIASLPFGKHLWISPILKLAYSVSCILSFCGLSFKKNRY